MMDAIRLDRLRDGGYVVTNAGNGQCVFASDSLWDALEYCSLQMEPVEPGKEAPASVVTGVTWDGIQYEKQEAPKTPLERAEAHIDRLDAGELGRMGGVTWAHPADVGATNTAPGSKWVK